MSFGIYKRVGGKLGISEIAVKAHRGHLMSKMMANALAELVTMAVTLRLVIPRTWGAAAGDMSRRFCRALTQEG